MKKAFIILAVMAACVTANAQWTITGTFGLENSRNNSFNINDGKVGDKVNLSKYNLYYINPEAGYRFDKWEFGVGAFYSFGKNMNTDENPSSAEYKEYKGHNYGGDIYARRYFELSEKFYLFAETALMGWISTGDKDVQDIKEKYHILKAYISPGLGYNISDHWSIDAYIDCLGINYYFYKDANKFEGEVYDANSYSEFSIFGDGFEAPVSISIAYKF